MLIKKILSENSIKVCSFDVFDTVITRKVSEPVAVFEKMQCRLKDICFDLPDFFIDEFKGIRIESESMARKKSLSEDIVLDEIYDLMGHIYGLSKLQTDRLKKLEICEEKKLVVPIVDTIEKIKELKSRGYQIVYISDMYLPEEVIRELLNIVGVSDGKDKIFVSGEVKASKATGNLFYHVLNELCIDKKGLFHYGDNRWSDYRVPLKIGIMAELFSKGGQNKYESILYKSKVYSSRIDYCGASRSARLQCSGLADDKSKARFDLGANVAGPVLCSFVFWVLQQAKLHDVRRLYFFSRDGQILLRIAESLNKRYSLNLELRYLFVSRLVTNNSIVKKLTKDSLAWVKADNVILSVKVILKRLCFADSEIDEFQERGLFECNDLDARLSKSDVDEFVDFVCTNKFLSNYVEKKLNDCRDKFISYLTQEHLFDEVNSAVVDLGWSGTIQDNIYSIICDVGVKKRLYGFYFGITKESIGNNYKHGYLYNPYSSTLFNSFGPAFNIIMEIFCTADHGMVLGYNFNNSGNFAPLFSKLESNKNVDFVKSFQEGLFEFLDHLNVSPEKFQALSFKSTSLALLKAFCFRVGYNEVLALEDVCFSGDAAGERVKCFIPEVSFVDAIKYYFSHSFGEKVSKTYWLCGSYKKSSIPSRLVLLPLYCYFQAMSFVPDRYSVKFFSLISSYRKFLKRAFRG